MIVTHKIGKMDLLAAPGVIPRIDVMQNDCYSRDVQVLLFAGSQPWNPPKKAWGLVRYQKSDGTGGTYDALPDNTPAVKVRGNVLTVALAPQVCTAPGTVELAVALRRGETLLHTFRLEVHVEHTPGLEVVSEDYIKLIGVVPDGGWAANMYLGTDENGDVVAKPAPAGGGGTAVLATAIDVVKEEQTITMTTTLENGGTTVTEIALDENERPTMITTNGIECPVTWEGFVDEELVDVSEVGA